MLIEIKAPEVYSSIKYNLNTYPSLFMAGGISNCSDWQVELANKLDNENLVIFNPRRDDFNVLDPAMELEQIQWEHRYLREAQAVLFWFPKETLCPITLFELGATLERTRVVIDNDYNGYDAYPQTIFIGTDPDYKRRRDVEIQTSLVLPGINIVDSIDGLASQVKQWVKQFNEG